MGFKFLWICICALVLSLPSLAQRGDSAQPRTDSVPRPPARDSLGRSIDSLALARALRRHRRDSLARVARLDSVRQVREDSIALALRADSLRRVGALGPAAAGGAGPGDGSVGDNASKANGATPALASRAKAGSPPAGPPPPAGRPNTRAGTPKVRLSRELLFYVILALALWMGLLKTGYAKYYSDLFTVFFRSSLRQHQIREQLLQARLPSLLFNLFFVGCAGTFLYLLESVYSVKLGRADWELWVGAIMAVALLYSAKFVGLKLSGWIFGMSPAVDTYIFIVFLVNKILGVALLPVVVLLAFTRDPLQSAGATLGVLLVAGMLMYRFIRSYRPVWEEVQMSRLHFFLYLCAFEIAPLLLIYKTMLRLLG